MSRGVHALQLLVPLADLEPFLAMRLNHRRHKNDCEDTGFPAIFERFTGINRGQYHRCVRAGGYTLAMADRIADALGYHPAEIWGEAWWQASDMEGEVA